jgi:hypothetical protein
MKLPYSSTISYTILLQRIANHYFNSNQKDTLNNATYKQESTMSYTYKPKYTMINIS